MPRHRIGIPNVATRRPAITTTVCPSGDHIARTEGVSSATNSTGSTHGGSSSVLREQLLRPCSELRRGVGSVSGAQNKRQANQDAERARRSRKERRYDLRTFQWEVSSLERCRKCGGVPMGQSVGLRMEGERAGFSGLTTCGSVWSCNVCASKIAVHREQELFSVLQWATEQGHTSAMLTLTASHQRWQGLEEVWDGVQRVWRRMTKGRPWRRLIDRYGLHGWARITEVTRGEQNGWHPHFHIPMVLDGNKTPATVEQFGEEVWPLWVSALEKEGLSAMRDPGLDIRTSRDDVAEGLSKYLVKSLAIEATHGHAKDGRSGSRTPFQILANVQVNGDADDLALWHEWERVSRGRRQITWSQGLRDMAGLAEEMEDHEIAEEEIGGEDVMVFDLDTWREIAPQQVGLLIAAEQFGLVGARAWYRGRGFEWRELQGVGVPPGAPPSPGTSEAS